MYRRKIKLKLAHILFLRLKTEAFFKLFSIPNDIALYLGFIGNFDNYFNDEKNKSHFGDCANVGCKAICLVEEKTSMENLQYQKKKYSRRSVALKRLNLAIFLTIMISTILITFIPQSFAHSCSYKIPDADSLVYGVPLTIESPEFEMDGTKSRLYKRNVIHGQRVRRDSVIDRPYQPLRIALYFDPTSINPLSTETQIFINTSLLPHAIGFWEQTLSVRPTNAPIRLSRKCKTNQYYVGASETHPTCVDRCKPVTNCGEVSIPDEHLFQCRYCALPNPLSCTFSGPENGVGVSNADFLLYVSAVSSQRCENKNTIAYAAHCQQEAELDRPIAGHVNICPNALSTHAHDQEILLSTVKHEILHALGFSAGLYAFFRHSDGSPRTKRNRHNKPITFNRERGYYDADESTIKTILRNDWWTADNTVPHSVHLMITEKVVEEARRHFNCSILEGAELENQGGDGTALTHWEKRLFENEAMTGTHTQNPVYSRLTLALMEDSGWYKANYSVSEHLHWGNNLGCEFSMKSCGEWIKNRLEKNLSTAPFCHQIKHDGHKSLATTRCTDQRDSLALCNLIPYQQALPVEYRNFKELKGVKKEGIKYYGGSVELADFCPYNQEFEWKLANLTDRRRDSRCELRGNTSPRDSNHVMEVYGVRSKCFDLVTSWTERKCGRVKTYSQFMAGCYQFVCQDGRVNLKIAETTKFYPCYYAGQPIYVRRIINGWLREGIIKCPPCKEICSAPHLWHSSHQNLIHQFDVKTGADENYLKSNSIVEDNVDSLSMEMSENGTSILPFLFNENIPLDLQSVQTERQRRREILSTIIPSTIFTPTSNLPQVMECAPDRLKDEVFGEIGDPPVEEPCSALRTLNHELALFTVSLISVLILSLGPF